MQHTAQYTLNSGSALHRFHKYKDVTGAYCAHVISYNVSAQSDVLDVSFSQQNKGVVLSYWARLEVGQREGEKLSLVK